MAFDTLTSSLKLLKQATGNNNNSWGENLNTQVIDRIEAAFVGLTSIAATGAADITLTDDQALSATISISGTLTADQVIIVPAYRKNYTFINNTTGNFYVLVKVAGSSTFRNLPLGLFVDLFSDGTTIYRKDGNAVGEIFYHAGAVPAGALECTGGLVKRTSAVDLYAAIGTTWGAGDGITTFRLPYSTDTGRFLRSRATGVPVGTYQSSQNLAHTHTGSGTTSVESNTHTHGVTGTTSTQSANHGHTGSGTTSGYSNDHSHTYSGNTGTISSDHAHTGGGTTSGFSANHIHNANGSTGGVSAYATHGHSVSGGTIAGTGVVNIQAQAATNVPLGFSGINIDAAYTDHTHNFNINTGTVSSDHTHTYSFGTSGVTANHTHGFSGTTSGTNANHTHTFSFSTSVESSLHTHSFSVTSDVPSVQHTHTYSFTTSSNGGTEARPESMVAIMCIRY